MKSADGRDTENIKQGSSLAHDRHAGEHFHYQTTNPPYGKDWRIDAGVVNKEAALDYNGRFGAGTPRTSDGQLLFPQHMLAYIFPDREKGEGGRIAIIMNGSPLFTGDAGSGESKICRWIIEHDWLEAIIARPEQLFYNTGIATYVWILSNRKPEACRGKIQRIDASDPWEARRKSLGDKRRDITETHHAQIVQMYLDFYQVQRTSESALHLIEVFPNPAFGFRKVTVERPLRLNFQTTPERIAHIDEQRAFQALARSRKKDKATRAVEEAAGRAQQAAIKQMIGTLPDILYRDRAAFTKISRPIPKPNNASSTGSLSSINNRNNRGNQRYLHRAA